MSDHGSQAASAADKQAAYAASRAVSTGAQPDPVARRETPAPQAAESPKQVAYAAGRRSWTAERGAAPTVTTQQQRDAARDHAAGRAHFASLVAEGGREMARGWTRDEAIAFASHMDQKTGLTAARAEPSDADYERAERMGDPTDRMHDARREAEADAYGRTGPARASGHERAGGGIGQAQRDAARALAPSATQGAIGDAQSASQRQQHSAQVINATPTR